MVIILLGVCYLPPTHTQSDASYPCTNLLIGASSYINDHGYLHMKMYMVLLEGCKVHMPYDCEVESE